MKVVMNLNQNLSARTILARGTSQLALRAWKKQWKKQSSQYRIRSEEADLVKEPVQPRLPHSPILFFRFPLVRSFKHPVANKKNERSNNKTFEQQPADLDPALVRCIHHSILPSLNI